jgi:hypothetical protein
VLDTAAAEAGPKVAVVSFGLFGDQSVFESEAKGAAAIVANRFGGGPVMVRANTKRRGDATAETLASSLDSVAKEIDHENDILVLILTSHGYRGCETGSIRPTPRWRAARISSLCW